MVPVLLSNTLTFSYMAWKGIGMNINTLPVVALLWLLHPLQTEAVTYVSQRSESLVGLFYFLTLYGFVRSATAAAPAFARASAWV